jgi:hypothetical protein
MNNGISVLLPLWRDNRFDLLTVFVQLPIPTLFSSRKGKINKA